MADGPVTRIEWVEEQLRTALLNGELKPGERLLTAQLSERFAVSPTPLREALHRFAGEGLVEFLPQKGARVAPLTAVECRELAEMRSTLDPLAVEHAVAHGDDAWRVAVKEASARLRSALESDPHDQQASEAAYRSFYATLTLACDSRLLRRLATAVRDQQARYRLVAIDHVDRRSFIRRHVAIVRATMDGDAATAAKGVVDEVDTLAACCVDITGAGENETVTEAQ